MRGHQSRTYLVKHANDDLLADSHNIWNRWKDHFSQLWNVHRVNDARKMDIHTDEPAVLDLRPYVVEIIIGNFG
jgi:hypothetical protein